jgi:hypothetical protein
MVLWVMSGRKLCASSGSDDRRELSSGFDVRNGLRSREKTSETSADAGRMLRGAVETVAPGLEETEVGSEEREKERFENMMERDVPRSPRCTFPQGDEVAWVDDGRTETQRTAPKDSNPRNTSMVRRFTR